MQTDNHHQVHADFFQIDDLLPLDYHPLTESAAHELAQAEPSSLFALLAELQHLEHDSQHLLRQVAERDRALAAYLKILNKRIELLGRALGLQLSADMDTSVAVTLSEGGLTFPVAQPLQPGDWLALRLLLPTPAGLSIAAQIADCTLDPASGQYLIQVGFDQLTDTQRQLITRHIMHRQAQQIRAAKHNERTSS